MFHLLFPYWFLFQVRFEKFKESFVSILCGTQVTDGEGFNEVAEENTNHNGTQEEETGSLFYIS